MMHSQKYGLFVLSWPNANFNEQALGAYFDSHGPASGCRKMAQLDARRTQCRRLDADTTSKQRFES